MAYSGGKFQSKRHYSSAFACGRKDDANKRAKVASMPNNAPLGKSGDHLTTNMSPDQLQAFKYAIDDGKSILLTGPAGCGKSWLLGRIIKGLQQKYGPNSVFVTASTGTAALNISGTTLHSFSGCGLGTKTASALASLMKPKKANGWLSCCCLIVDEISMISPAYFDLIEQVAGLVRRRSSEAFGGVQIIVCGDFFQLPPVVIEDKSAAFPERCDDEIEAPPRFVFEGLAWKKTIHRVFQLTTAHRQSGDTEFLDILNSCRQGVVSDAQYERLLQTVPKSQTSAQVAPPTDDKGDIPKQKATILYSRKNNVRGYNETKLMTLNGEVKTFESIDWHNNTDDGKIAMQQIITGCIAERKLELKEGALVILLKNLDPSVGLVNGSQGIIITIHPAAPLQSLEEEAENGGQCEKVENGKVASNDGLLASEPIVIDDTTIATSSAAGAGNNLTNVCQNEDGEYTYYSTINKPRVTILFSNGILATIGPQKWEIADVDDENIHLAYREQIPLALGWALTIHKSQGMTLANATVDISGSFECGMAYVALSRATSLSGLTITRKFTKDVIYAHPKVVQFYEECDENDKV